ncbi:hypothetical protein MIND_00141400 [Mycena indigotica]|uniref:F-box domain-containing protein n=1 Tax=Mycena indigotica TaxID=2126181 RepID=A0A8H6TCT9_9AGAR|nr:uncharacterized protein MIND_00141400 [Mycena indigotica]KAF7316228.1 hypothetical protein MIND_00141400 [Mycena indigotica]
MVSKRRQRSLPMSLLLSVIKHHLGDLHACKTKINDAHLPLDIVYEIAERLENTEDILHFSLASSRIYNTLLPVLYTSVDLRSSQSCQRTLTTFLTEFKSKARFIRHLVVRPNHRSQQQQYATPIDEHWVVQCIVKLANSGRLPRLASFFWDGSEMPIDDSLWATLRACCPQLRGVGSNVGPKCINPASELFRFDDLTAFALTAKTLPDEWDTFLPPNPELPDQLWEMLLDRCPRLEQLQIEVSQRSRRVWDTRRVVQGNWLMLRDLKLGECNMAGPNPSRFGMETPFMRFLVAHPALERLQLPSLSAFPRAMILPPNSLPKLREFSGNATHIRGLSNLANIQTLSLAHQPLSNKVLSLVCGTLKHMHSLDSLSVWLHLDSQTDHYAIFRNLLCSCRTVRHLDIACSDSPWDMSQFISALRGASMNLVTLTLTRVEHATGGPDLHKVAFQLAVASPSLRRIALRYSFTTWVFMDSIPFQQTADFVVKSDNGGLDVKEKNAASRRSPSVKLHLPKWT